jgi:hypothetical protein
MCTYVIYALYVETDIMVNAKQLRIVLNKSYGVIYSYYNNTKTVLIISERAREDNMQIDHDIQIIYSNQDSNTIYRISSTNIMSYGSYYIAI